jgi:hypothetical protein
MSTYGGLIIDPTDSPTWWTYLNDKGEWFSKSFQYTQPFSNHKKFRHSVDDHNNNRHCVPSIEGSWVTNRWKNHVFAFILALVKVTAFWQLSILYGSPVM